MRRLSIVHFIPPEPNGDRGHDLRDRNSNFLYLLDLAKLLQRSAAVEPVDYAQSKPNGVGGARC